MSLTRRLARPFLSAIFVWGGLDSVRHPDSKVDFAKKVTDPLVDKIPGLPQDPATLVRINGAVQLGAGVLLATGKFRRLAAMALIGSVIPTTYAGHQFWAEDEEGPKKLQLSHFLKNLAILGGLIFAALDNEGAP